MTPCTVQLCYEDEVIALRILAMYRLGMVSDVEALSQFAECFTVIDLKEVKA